MALLLFGTGAKFMFQKIDKPMRQTQDNRHDFQLKWWRLSNLKHKPISQAAVLSSCFAVLS